MIDVRTGSNSVQVTLSSVQGERPASPWVSARQLKRKPNGKAERELRKARAALESGRFDEAIQHSSKALALDPTYPEALVALGVAQSRLGRFEEASEQFTKAAELDPAYESAHSNLAIAMLRLRRFGAAEEAARRSLKIVRPLPTMDYVLGVSLGAQNRNLDEAIEHLDQAAGSHPRAGVAAAQLLIEAGRRSDAAKRLGKYLRVCGDVQDRKDLESLLAQLK
jgi:tetratricopeptide (TPR) repeat protein